MLTRAWFLEKSVAGLVTVPERLTFTEKVAGPAPWYR